MEKLRCKTPLSLLLFQISSLLLIASSYTPSGNKYYINCGSDSNAILNATTFVGDLSAGGLLSFSPGRSEAVIDADPPTNSPALYHTVRIYRSPSSYEVAMAEGEEGTHLVRLHFFPFPSRPDLAAALFNVSASGYSLLSDFRVPNGTQTPVIREFLLTINETKFGIYFTPLGSSLAFVNAIEVLSAPETLLPGNATRVTAAGITGKYTGPLSQALQTVHRLNVGGPFLWRDDDSLGREWVPDDGFLIDPDRAKNATYFPGQLNHGDGGATEDVASPLVYRTAKESINRSSSSFSNITWKLNVSKNAAHFVRLHFCDILNPTVSDLAVFNLYIYGRFNQGINTYPTFTETQTPFYLDFVVDSDDSGFMSVSIGPQAEFRNATAFLNGLEMMKLSVPMQGLKKRKNVSLIAIIGPVAGGAALISIMVAVILRWLRCQKAKKKPIDVANEYGEGSDEGIDEGDADTFLDSSLHLNLLISLDEILRATRNFAEEMRIGQGGFGDVYRGTLDNGEKVAVKRHKRGKSQGSLEFCKEVTVYCKIRHRNLVSLIGYCRDGSEMILVYEFMDKGTLTSHLYDSDGNPKCQLPWKDRLEICIGAATGLKYLHTDSEPRVIHRDIKSENILLDKDFSARVADFGISKVGPVDQNPMSDFPIGTVGYMDVEYFTTRNLTEKSDVYAFGVVLLEVLCARRPISNGRNLAKIVEEASRIEEIIDPFLLGKVNLRSVEKFVETALRCVEKQSVNRPTMSDVLSDLEGLLTLEKGGEEMDGGTRDGAFEMPLRKARQYPPNYFVPREEFADSGTYGGSDTTASEVFSQLKIDLPR